MLGERIRVLSFFAIYADFSFHEDENLWKNSRVSSSVKLFLA
jgi:hypothetical protein